MSRFFIYLVSFDWPWNGVDFVWPTRLNVIKLTQDCHLKWPTMYVILYFTPTVCETSYFRVRKLSHFSNIEDIFVGTKFIDSNIHRPWPNLQLIFVDIWSCD